MLAPGRPPSAARRRAALLAPTAAVCAFIAATATAQPVSPQPAFRILSVPSNEGQRDIRVGVAAATEPRAGAEPIFVVEALGESGVDAADRGLIDSLKTLRRTHDLVFVDQPGTSGASLLACPHPAGGSAAEGLFAPAHVAACRQAYAGRGDLRDLNGHRFATDLETVRRALNYGRIELIGYFYGTRIVEDYLRRWPERVSAAVLADVSPFEVSPAEAASAAIDAAVRSTLAACRSDRACDARYPALDRDWSRVSSALAAASPDDPEGPGMLAWLRVRTLRWRTATAWPHDVHELAIGRAPALDAQYLAYQRSVSASYPLALRLSVDCAENLPRQTRPAAHGPRRSGDLAMETAACAGWPSRPPPAAYFRPLRTSAPVLAVTADFDVEATPSQVRRSLAASPHARIVVFRGRARATDFDWDDCLGPMATAFLQSRGLGGVDAACAAHLERPPFAEPPAR